MPCYRSLALAAALVAVACAPRHPYELAPGAPPASGVRVVFLAPVNPFSRIADELQGPAERLRAAVVEYLETSHGKRVLSSGLQDFREAAGIAMAATEDPIDAERGELVPAAMAVLIAELRAGGDFDVLVLPELISREADLRLGKARWDGVTRKQPGVEPGTYPDGRTSGLSLRVRIFAPDGRRLFDGIGGLDLVFRLDLVENRMILVDSPLGHRPHLDEGVAIAFHPYLAPPGP